MPTSARPRHERTPLALLTIVIFVVMAGCGSSGDGAVTSPDGGAAPDPVATTASGGGPADAAGADADAGALDAGPPEIPRGTPISAPDGTWTNVPFPDGYCRDGTPAHLMVHPNSKSKKIAIYLEGGGACFNDASCNFLTFDVPLYMAGGGIFNFGRMDNPIRDWNIFYVPYCTGDVHAGSNPMGTPGPVTGPQRYTGYSNLRLYLSRILATVPDATDEAILGSSAGGFGVGLTADLVARNAPPSVERFTMIDDSGQPMSSQVIVPCLQDLWRKTWGFDDTVLKDCGAACPKPNDYVYDWMQFLMNKYAKGPFAKKFMGGLISWTSDAIIRTFYGFGANNCTAAAPVQVGGAQFEAGLLDFRSKIQSQTSSFGTYFAGGSAHTFLLLDGAGAVQNGLLGGLYDTNVGGVRLVDWLADLLAHQKAAHVGP